MKVHISKIKFIYLSIVFLLMIFSTIIISSLSQNDIKTLKMAVIVQFSMFIALFIVLGRINKSMVTLYSVFMIVFYLFQNGQLLLYSLNVDYDFFYVEKFPPDMLHEVVLFSNLCMFSAFAAAVFSFDEKKGYIAKKVDVISPKFIYDASIIGLTITGLVTGVLTIIKILIWLRGRYLGVMAFESVVPSIIGLVEALFPAFCILSIVSGAKSGKKTSFIVGLFLVWGLLTALMGDRTTGIGVIVILSMMYYHGIVGKSGKMKKTGFYVACALIVLLIAFAANFRNQQSYTAGSFFGVITDVVYELGFSFFPLAGIMDMCPGTHDYLYGSSMFSSVVTGFFPETLDIFGIFSNLADEASIPTKWIADRYQYGFGMDCSLNAEAYANFGMYGFLAMFVICAIVAACLRKVDYKSDENVFSQYIGFALLFGWFTLPRRRSYYIYNKIFWYVIIIAVFVGALYLLYNRKKRKK